MSRYVDRLVGLNSDPMYHKQFEARGVRAIEQYHTAEFSYPSSHDIALRLQSIPHIWKVGDRFFKLAHHHYGDASKWWLIALFNQKPTEAHVKMGDIIFIPAPLESAMALLRV
jgi:nucleoid-associated protein YgaU